MTPPTQGALTHQAFFWLKNSKSPGDTAALVAGLKKLEAIPVLRHFQLGLPASTEQRDVVDSSFDVLEFMIFDNLEDQKIYQDHPIHQAFIADCGHLWERVVVYDTIGV